MTTQNFRFDVDADGVALITWDMPGRSMNVLTPEVIEELNALVDKVAAEAAIKGAVVTSGKEGFSGGADLAMLQGMGGEYARVAKAEGEEAAMRFFFDRSRQLSLIYRKLETCGKPFAAAINGVCMGGAFELALSCHYRVVADADKARVGLPEIKVGLFPGAGGTQRVARLMATPDALQMLFKGEQLKPAAAKRMGLVHDVAPPSEIVARAKEWVKANPNAKAPWDDPKFKPPSGRVFSSAGMMIWAPANAILPPRNLRQLSRSQGDPLLRVRGPAIADGPGAGGGEPLLRQDPALQGSGGDDPLAVRLDGRTEQGRAPAARSPAAEAAQDRRPRRRLHGRRRRLCLGERRARSRADRPRPGDRPTRARRIRRSSISNQIAKGRAKKRRPRRAARSASIRAPITPI